MHLAVSSCRTPPAADEARSGSGAFRNILCIALMLVSSTELSRDRIWERVGEIYGDTQVSQRSTGRREPHLRAQAGRRMWQCILLFAEALRRAS
jgi:hypothetical protein